MTYPLNEPLINTRKLAWRLTVNVNHRLYEQVRSDLGEAGLGNGFVPVTDALWEMGGRSGGQDGMTYGDWRVSIGLPRDPDAVPEPIRPGPGPRKVRGQIRFSANGREFVDDNGPLLPVFCHAGDLYALWTRDKDWARQEMVSIKTAGWMGVRTWALLGGNYWERLGRTVQTDQIGEFAADLWSHGLRLMLSMGDMTRLVSPGDWMRTMETVARSVMTHVPVEAIASIDGSNEGYVAFPLDRHLKALNDAVGAFRAICPVPIASLTDSPEDDLWRYHGSHTTVWDVHGYRKGVLADKVRHVYSILHHAQFEGAGLPTRLGIQSEPPGVWSEHSLVSEMENPRQMTEEAANLLAAQHLMFRQWHVWFSSPGVSIRKPGEFMSQPGFRSVPRLAARLPPGIMGWGRFGHGGEGQSFRPFTASPRENHLRVDWVEQVQAGKIAALFYAEHGSLITTTMRDMRGRVLDLQTLEWGPDIHLSRGETVHPGHGRYGALWVGELT